MIRSYRSNLFGFFLMVRPLRVVVGIFSLVCSISSVYVVDMVHVVCHSCESPLIMHQKTVLDYAVIFKTFDNGYR